MENQEIIEMRKLKKKLLKKMICLRDRLKNLEENGHEESIDFNINLPCDDDNQELMDSQSTRYKAELCEVTGQVTGITFQNVDKQWLRDNVYMYTAKVLTKTVSFDVKLTVSFKNSNGFKIEDIMCYFININDCYMLEISPWFQKFANINNFSFLISALSEYNKNNIFRSKILHNLESKQYVNVEECVQENGGLVLHVHSPLNTNANYIIVQWALKFLDLTWQIEHFFTMKPTDIGMEFSEENRSLLKEFCKIGLTKNNLLNLWEKLCIAVDMYQNKNI